MSLQGLTASQIAESRPLPRDHKKLGLFKRWAVSIRRFHGYSSHNNISIISDNNHNSTNRNRTHSNGTDSMTSSSSSPSLNIVPCSSSSSIKGLLDFHHNHPQYDDSNSNINNRNKGSIKHMATHCPSRSVSLPQASLSVHSSDPKNIFHWMQTDCPKDVLPLILAFAGPQKIAVIQRTNLFWRLVIQQEATWRRLCEELYKWKEGDEIPNSWKNYYQYNPCVPVDYSTIHNALNDAIGKAKEDPSEPSAVRVLLRPGRYVLREAITVDEGSAGKNNGGDGNNHPMTIAIETMEYIPENCQDGAHDFRGSIFRLSSNKSKRKRKKSIRNFFNCRTMDVESEEEEDILDHESLHEYLNNPSSFSDGRPATQNRDVAEDERSMSTTDNSDNYGKNQRNNPVVNRATLVLTTRRHNEPLLRIRQGCCTIRNIDFRHGSYGNDIWNGNAAIQIQPPVGPNNEPLDVPAPSATLDRVDVTSSSGRGVVNIDGGHLKISNSFIHDCAATGIYVGGPGSRATLEQTDVLFNGKGNKRNRRGIARGHSGIYMEQGHATITDCNISSNTLTGISVISPGNALISLQESDLISNGTFPLELPAVGTVSYRNSVTVNNNLASHGKGRTRSGFVVE